MHARVAFKLRHAPRSGLITCPSDARMHLGRPNQSQRKEQERQRHTQHSPMVPLTSVSSADWPLRAGEDPEDALADNGRRS